MLDLPRYLLGVAELAWLAGFAWLGGVALRRRLLSAFSGAPAHLAAAVISLALLIWAAEILGSFGLLEPAAYLAATAVAGLGLWLWVGGGWGRSPRMPGFSPEEEKAARERRGGEKEDAAAREERPHPPSRSQAPETGGDQGPGTGSRQGPGTERRCVDMATVVALAIAAIAVVHFAVDIRSKLLTGMTGFDSTWYHGPFAAGFFQSGDTWSLRFIAPQFLAWFYPANAELFHAAGMLAFGRDVLSPLLNLGWLLGCLLACWCIGRPYQVAPWSLALGAVALSLPVLADQAGEARNDIVGIFFLLAAVAIALNDRPPTDASVRAYDRIPTISANGAVVAGLSAGLAAGVKLNFLLPAAVLVVGLAFVAPVGRRRRAFAAGLLAALLGGGYWYLRNLVHSGNPLPWFGRIGPISLPVPEQALGGREGHSVLGYLGDGSVWSVWFLPGLHGGLTILWPLIAAGALAGLLLCLVAGSGNRGTGQGGRAAGLSHRRADRALWIAGLAGLGAIVAWLVAPTSASGPDGMPRGFESGLRYLAPALVLGLALLPATPPLRSRLPRLRASMRFPLYMRGNRMLALLGAALALAIGYPAQRHYLENRYANPTFAAPGLNAAFKWASRISNARIATTSTRQYPLFGADLSNHVQYVGEHRPHGGFTAPASCQQWRRLLGEGNYDYVVASRDRIEPGKPPYPPTARWTEGPGAAPILKTPPTVVFRLKGSLDPSACP